MGPCNHCIGGGGGGGLEFFALCTVLADSPPLVLPELVVWLSVENRDVAERLKLNLDKAYSRGGPHYCFATQFRDCFRDSMMNSSGNHILRAWSPTTSPFIEILGITPCRHLGWRTYPKSGA